MKYSLPSQAIKRPITVSMMVLTIVVLGAIAGQRLPLEFLPAMEFPFLGCFISYPGATPSQIEQEIAIPAEGEFRTLRNLKNLYTFSNDGGCFVHFNFEWGTNMAEAQAEVRDRIERLRLELPPEADRIFMRYFDSESMPVIQLGITREGDFKEFAHLARTELLPKLQRIEGVAEIEMFGAEDESVLIEFDQNALQANNLSLFEVTTALQNASLNLSAGELLDGNTQYLVRAMGEFHRPEEMADLVIGNGLRVKDVARVGYKPRDQDWHYSLDGKPQLFILIKKEAEANTVSTCTDVLDEFQRVIATPEFEGTNYRVFQNQADIIVSALDGLRGAGQYGGILALVVIFLFLGRIRPTLVVGLAIPGSLVIGLVVMYFVGMTLNLVTMMSMIIAIGMVVDNSIVVIENIYRYRSLGLSPMDAASKGANEVALAITAATLTTAVVFVPVVYMEGGEMSTFMRQFAVPVTVSLAGSLLIALTVIPLAASRFRSGQRTLFDRLFRRAEPSARSAASMAGAGKISLMRPIMPIYKGALSFAIRQRLATFLMIGGFVWLTYAWPMKEIGTRAMPEMDQRRVEVSAYFDPNYDMERTGAVINQMHEVIEARRDELGIKNIFKHYTPRRGSLELWLVTADDLPEGEKPPYTSDEVMDILWEIFPERVPGARLRFRTAGESSTGGGGGQGRISLRLEGDDMDRLNVYADRLVDLMESLPGVTEADKGNERVDQEIQLDVDEVIAAQMGVHASTVAQTVGFALVGARLPELKQDGREIPVWAQFREEDRESKANLDNVMVLGSNGLVPVSQLVNYSKAESPQSIERVNGKNYINVSARAANEDMAEVKAYLEVLRDNFELPTGYALTLGDELMNLDQNQHNFAAALLLSIILIYIVMSALFESVLLPLSILTTIPLAFVGVVWFMFLTGSSLDTIAFLGMILLVGLIVNNGIVIVDYINNLRRNEGYNRYDAIMKAGTDRLRPVLMTAITTILGAVPLAVTTQGNGAAIQGLGRALIGGLTSGTFLTLLVVPLVYTLFDDLQHWLVRYAGNILSLGRQKAQVN